MTSGIPSSRPPNRPPPPPPGPKKDSKVEGATKGAFPQAPAQASEDLKGRGSSMSGATASTAPLLELYEPEEVRDWEIQATLGDCFIKPNVKSGAGALCIKTKNGIAELTYFEARDGFYFPSNPKWIVKDVNEFVPALKEAIDRPSDRILTGDDSDSLLKVLFDQGKLTAPCIFLPGAYGSVVLKISQRIDPEAPTEIHVQKRDDGFFVPTSDGVKTFKSLEEIIDWVNASAPALKNKVFDPYYLPDKKVIDKFMREEVSGSYMRTKGVAGEGVKLLIHSDKGLIQEDIFRDERGYYTEDAESFFENIQSLVNHLMTASRESVRESKSENSEFTSAINKHFSKVKAAVETTRSNTLKDYFRSHVQLNEKDKEVDADFLDKLYKVCARKLHPDKVAAADKPAAEELTKALNAARKR